jgi:large subunit ribosomal protein L24
MEKKEIANRKIKIRKGDLVKVIAGDSKGSQGKIVEVIKLKTGLLLKVPIWYQNILNLTLLTLTAVLLNKKLLYTFQTWLVDPKTGATTRVGRKLNDAGKLVRVAKKSGEEIK